MIKLSELEIPLASEILDPLTIHYFQDLITWGFIGSRTSSSQIHRQLASDLPFPVGIKNNNDGNLDIAIDSVLAARAKHSYLNITEKGYIGHFNSKGNPFSHIILRGSETKTNYQKEDIIDLYQKLSKRNTTSPIVVDCSHGNSKKNLLNQKKCFEEVLKQTNKDPNLIGIMLESFLKEGCQKLNKNLKYGVSVTDPCISWEDTEELLTKANLPDLRL